MPLAKTLGMRTETQTAEKVVMVMDWAPALCTANGILHGGAVMALADSAGAACAILNLPEGAAGTTTLVVETVVSDSTGRLVAKVTQTQLVLR